MKRKAAIILTIIIGSVFLANLPWINGVFNVVLDEGHYSYGTSNGTFTFTEFKSRDKALMERLFDRYKTKYGENGDTILYRTFRRNPLAFWRYKDYLSGNRYDLPYLSKKEIQKNREQQPVVKGRGHYEDW